MNKHTQFYKIVRRLLNNYSSWICGQILNMWTKSILVCWACKRPYSNEDVLLPLSGKSRTPDKVWFLAQTKLGVPFFQRRHFCFRSRLTRWRLGTYSYNFWNYSHYSFLSMLILLMLYSVQISNIVSQ